MQQILNKLKLSSLASVVQHIEQPALSRLPVTTFAQSRLPSGNDKNISTSNECMEHRAGKSISALTTRQKARRAKMQCNARLSRGLNLNEAVSRNGDVDNINSFAQKKQKHSLHLPSCIQCLRNFNTTCGSHQLLQASPPVMSHHTRNIWDIYKRLNFGNYAVLDELGEVGDPHHVPSHIRCPPYAVSGQPPQGPRGPEVKAEWQVDAVRESSRLARGVLNAVGENIQAGMTTEDIDALVHNRIIESGGYPSPLNYQGFPKSVCTSVNNVACHGIPNDRQLLDGDIISVDVTVFYNGYHGDCCETYLIGDVDKVGRHLVEAARRCRDEAIAICRPGVPFSDIGAKVEEVALQEKVTVVPCFVGHGIGHYFHGPPDIYHCYNDYPGTMEEGMTFTIEPIVAQGSREVLVLEDGWTAMMLDNGRAAQFEHTIHITDKGHEILSAYY